MSPKISDEHKELRRQQILEAAERVFIRKGYEPATMKDFVEEAEMSRGWIYLYFQSKEEIFGALMEKFDTANAKEMNEQLEETDSTWEALVALLNQQKKDLSATAESLSPTFYEYYLSGWRDSLRREQLTRRFERSIAGYTRLLQTGVDRGEFNPSLPIALVAKIIVSQLDGILSHTLAVGAEQAEADRLLDALIVYTRQLLGVSK
ncbi:TetR family transcriptional regulator [Paenibacillus hexagrammi]|uniref:TetR family transcriptional regulator n=1 Tax=Paenibacillus hexagrammi TaxID=2908839 RepID=A0ABY3SJZ9_9BACL|nr:TetR family transcriptional regulator [Paenibacillus sp. YPD9-1]UJF33436.1 TetR family transcriptional regulator [Paenibacillus sp. YPD9-1]